MSNIKLKLQDNTTDQLYCPFDSDCKDDAKGASPSTETGALIFGDGKVSNAVQLAEATINIFKNPVFENNVTDDWTFAQSGTGGAVNRDTSIKHIGSASAKITAGTALTRIYNSVYSLANGDTLTLSGWARGGADPTGSKIQIGLWDSTTSAWRVQVSATVAADEEWEFLEGSWTNDTGGAVNCAVYLENAFNDSTTDVWFDELDLTNKLYPTPHCDGSLGTGHSWSGTAHNSTSSRTVTDLKYAITAGSAFTIEGWLKPLALPEEVTGTKRLTDWYNSADDWVRMYYDATNDYLSSMVFVNGSTSYQTYTGLTRNTWTHIAQIWDGSYHYLYINGSLEGTRHAIGGSWGTAPSELWVGGSHTGSGQINGWLDELVVHDRGLTASEIEHRYNENVAYNGVWNDIFEDVLQGSPCTAKTGIQSSGPASFMASGGNAKFTLDNSIHNSGSKQGYYSPDHDDCRSGFETGAKIRLLLQDTDGDIWEKWVGYITKILPDSGRHGSLTTKITCEDAVGKLLHSKLPYFPVMTDTRADDVIQKVFDILDNSDLPDFTGDCGSSLFAYAGDDVRQHTAAYEVIKNTMKSEAGYFMLNTDAANEEMKYHFYNRQNRQNPEAILTIEDDSYDNIKAQEIERDSANHVRVTVFPRTTDSDQDHVLWQLRGDSLAVQGSGSLTVNLQFRDPDNPGVKIAGLDIITPVADCDFTFSIGNTYLTPEFENYDSDIDDGTASVSLKLTNSSASAGNITALRVRGKRVLVYDPVDIVNYDSDQDQDRRFSIRLPYQDNVLEGTDIGAAILDAREDIALRLKSLSFYVDRTSTTLCDLAYKYGLNDCIVVNDEQTGIHGSFFINSANYKISPKDELHITYGLSRADTTIFMRVGDEIGPDTHIGF